MLNETKMKEYDEYLVDRESRELKGNLTDKEKAENAALKADKALVAEIFKNRIVYLMNKKLDMKN